MFRCPEMIFVINMSGDCAKRFMIVNLKVKRLMQQQLALLVSLHLSKNS